MLVKNKETHARIVAKWLDLQCYNLVLAHDETKWTWSAVMEAWEAAAK